MLSSKIRVAVLRGGPSPEYEVSLKTGQHILSLLREMSDKYEPIDIFISGEGEWHVSGLVEEPYRALRYTDAVWNAMHGAYGEDGQVQRFLESLKIPFTGSSSVASAMAMNKDLAKEIYKQHSLLTPKHEIFLEDSDIEDKLTSVFESYSHPIIIKPASAGSSLGVKIAHTFNELKDAVINAFKYSKKVLAEEFIGGTEATCGVVEGARNEKIYALMPEGELSSADKKEVQKQARLAHEVLGLRHYSSSDFIVTPKGELYLLETNSQPKFHADSHLYHSLQTAGWHPRDFVEHCLKLALKK